MKEYVCLWQIGDYSRGEIIRLDETQAERLLRLKAIRPFGGAKAEPKKDPEPETADAQEIPEDETADAEEIPEDETAPAEATEEAPAEEPEETDEEEAIPPTVDAEEMVVAPKSRAKTARKSSGKK